jgi:hypothetical protein
MGLKGYSLWAMGHLDSTCRAPPRVQDLVLAVYPGLDLLVRDVALQVAFERQTLKPFFSLDRL